MTPQNHPLDLLKTPTRRVFQRRAYGLKDEEYLRLKVLSCMLPVL